MVERSEYQWASFVTIDAGSVKGNNRDVMRYRYEDAFKSNKHLYYRLRQLDKDKKFDYSSIIGVSSAGQSEARVYPNRVSDQLYLDPGEFKMGRSQ